MNKLIIYRKKINKIDKCIVKLLLLRFKLVIKISNYKKINRIKIIDKERELQVLNNIKKYSNKKYQKFMINLFKNIINYSKKIQNIW